MRILVLDTHYQEALNGVYQSAPDFEQLTFVEQLGRIYESGFGRADFLPANLKRLGHDAEQFIANALPVQLQWAQEKGMKLSAQPGQLRKLRNLWKRAEWRFGIRSQSPGSNVAGWEMEVVVAQVKEFAPDVIFICDVLYLPADFHRQLKQLTRLLVGEMAYPIPQGLDLRPFDLIVSAAPHFVSRLRQSGARSELLRLGFESSILNRLDAKPKNEKVVFIGSVGKNHQQRLDLLEEVSRHVPLSCWGSGAENLPANSPLRARMKPALWGYDMYRQLQRADIALNIHIDMAEKYAANMRLYEATGVGTMLVTDWKENLDELFQPGVEVAAYRSPHDCAETISYYLEHDEEREAIAKAGQQRTLREHTYEHRMQELVEILERYLSQRSLQIA